MSRPALVAGSLGIAESIVTCEIVVACTVISEPEAICNGIELDGTDAASMMSVLGDLEQLSCTHTEGEILVSLN